MINRIKEVITYSGLSERGFAIKCGLKPTTINNQLIGKREISLATIIAISSSFEEISAEWLLRGTGSMLIQKEETERGFYREKVSQCDDLKKFIESQRNLMDIVLKNNQSIL